MKNFASRVLAWFDDHGRKDLPWQQNISPYRVWVSEIMLQQTQHWSGLGYYARARNLHRAAQIIKDDHKGVFPGTFDDVVELPGIGRSTAGAVLAIANGERHAILDGNVKRVLARHAAVEGWPGKTEVAARLWSIAEEHTPSNRVADYTQAIMDLGATLCTRSKPACDACPVSLDCTARKTDTIEQYPGRKAKKIKPLRQTTMVMAISDGAVFLERRPPVGIWGGLWSLPEVENIDEWCQQTLDQKADHTEPRAMLRHSFSHFDLDIQPVVVRVASLSRKVADSPDSTWHLLDEEPPGGMAAPVQQLLNSLKTRIH